MTDDHRQQIADRHGIPPDLLRGDTPEQLEAHAAAILTFAAVPPTRGNYAPREGHTTATMSAEHRELRDFTRDLFDITD